MRDGERLESKAFFFEKKKQKAFVTAVADSPAAYTKGTKVFWFLFAKKNRFAYVHQSMSRAVDASVSSRGRDSHLSRFASAPVLEPRQPVFKRMQSKQFFFEKKNQKTFGLCRCALVKRVVSAVRDSRDKSFLLLFSKKQALLSFLASRVKPKVVGVTC